jgi:hypothetical protein
MKKSFLSFAVAAMAAMMVSCGGNTNVTTNEDSTAVEVEEDAEKVEVEADEVGPTEEDRGWYTVAIPGGFEAKQYVSEMTVSGPVELNFKEQAEADVANWAKVMEAEADEQLDDISAADVTWQVYKNAEGYATVYLAQMGNGVIRIGSSSDNPNEAAVIDILNSIKLK